MSRFRLSILDTHTGAQAQLVPGGREERDLVNDIVTATVERGVGVFRTEAQVAEAVRLAVIEVLSAAKRDVRAPAQRPRPSPTSQVFTGQNKIL